ncbi:hypothetical protein ACTXT7_006933 [Hymenolepis weldensis]
MAADKRFNTSLFERSLQKQQHIYLRGDDKSKNPENHEPNLHALSMNYFLTAIAMHLLLRIKTERRQQACNRDIEKVKLQGVQLTM